MDNIQQKPSEDLLLKVKGNFIVLVTVCQGKNMLVMDKLTRSSDPWIELDVDGNKKKTDWKKNTLAPIYNQRFEFNSSTKPKHLTLTCFDWNLVGKSKQMGEHKIILDSYFDDTTECEDKYMWVTLTHEGKPAGEVQVVVKCFQDTVRKQISYSDYTHLLELEILNAQFDSKAHGKVECELSWDGEKYLTGPGLLSSNGEIKWNKTTFLWVNAEVQLHYHVLCALHEGKKPLGFCLVDFEDILKTPSVALVTKELTSERPVTDAALAKSKQEDVHEGDINVATGGRRTGSLSLRTSLKSKAVVEQEYITALLNEFGNTNAGDDNSLDYEEVAYMMKTIDVEMTDDLFLVIDKDKSGYVDRSELAHYIGSDQFQSLGLGSLLVHLKKHSDGHSSTSLMEGVTAKSSGKDEIVVKDLETGLLVYENIPKYIKAALHVMSGSKISRLVTGKAKKLMLNLSKKQGEKYDKPESAKEISSFIKLHSLDPSEVELPQEEYKTFNEFFARKLKSSARPIDCPDDLLRACSPADCRMMVFDDLIDATNFWIKGKNFTIEHLLGPQGQQYVPLLQGGSLAIARLAPQDYHRWHVPVSGVLGHREPIDGTLYSVNPIAINQAVDVYTENKRVLIPIQSTEFGLVMLVAVGAVMVGSIVLDGKDGDHINKGDLNGYFKFGGSTVLVLFEKGRINFRKELLENSKNHIETLIKCGQFMGTRRVDV